ncbi:MAG: hypothetical protein ACUVTU_08355 [Desulfurispora sp.]|uniref:hypothetical protein n=1 Tax=Desulfurispora sp. TaxID=3014275 RepID=UPI0040494845
MREALWPTDLEPYHIDINYEKDPRVFSNSFRQKVAAATNHHYLGNRGKIELEQGLWREKYLLYYTHLILNRLARLSHPCLIKGNALFLGGTVAHSELYVRQNVLVRENVKLRALATDGTFVALPGHLTVMRWLDSGGSMVIGQQSSVTQATSKRTLLLGPGCRLNILFAPTVRIVFQEQLIENWRQLLQASPHPHHRPFQTASADLPVYPDKHIASGTTVAGHIKCEADIHIEDNCLIAGNILGHSITVGNNCCILGNIFALGSITIMPGSTIGQPHLLKTIYARQKIILHGNVTLHGKALAEKGLFTMNPLPPPHLDQSETASAFPGH